LVTGQPGFFAGQGFSGAEREDLSGKI